MPQGARTSHPLYNVLPREIEGFDSLAELALNLRWSWNHATDEVWRQVPATRPVSHYSARVIPHGDGVVIPLEDAQIRWQR